MAEDDPEFRKTICDLFRLFNFHVSEATDGKEAWQLIQQNPYHIIVSDMKMPNMTGFELLRLVKARNVQFPKFIAISGFTDYSAADLYQAGVDGFFSKPFDASQVRDCINRSLVAASERWAQYHPKKSAYRLSKRFEKFDDALIRSDFFLGRIGFFMPMALHTPKAGEFVDFEISFGSPKPELEMRGFGQVRFVLEKSKQSLTPGVGVEILQLNKTGINAIMDYISKSNPIATIPAP